MSLHHASVDAGFFPTFTEVLVFIMIFMISFPLFEETFKNYFFFAGRLLLVVFSNIVVVTFKTVAFLQIRPENGFLSNKSDFHIEF